MIDKRCYLPAADEHIRKNMLRKSGPPENTFNSLGTPRHIRCMLKQTDIACHQAGRCETEYLPEGKVPGHNRQNDTQGFEGHITLAGIRIHNFVPKKAFCLPGIVATYPGALGYLRSGFPNDLAHLAGDEPGIFFFMVFQDTGGTVHKLRPRCKGSAAPGIKANLGPPYYLLDTRLA